MKNYYILFLLFTLFIFPSNAQITLTQSVDPNNVTDGGVACWSSASGEYRENSFYRAYNLADFAVTEDFQISSVEYGQGSADDGKVITVNIYTASTDNLATATLTLVQSATHVSNSADDLSLISVPITAIIPAGSTIAFEVLAGDSGTNIGETFFPGINAGGQNDDSYIKSTGCNINAPSTTASIGFADNQYVMNVVGNLLGIEEFSLDKVSVYPNPVLNDLHIDIHDSIQMISAKVYSITGQVVLQVNNKKDLDTSSLNSGVYLLKIETSKGSITRKIIKY
ncbi:T9SS type A sorting domain-containing protein [Formosa maritima]|nr:T9SS type A sorting domain-containing protein [Formosa maritima]